MACTVGADADGGMGLALAKSLAGAPAAPAGGAPAATLGGVPAAPAGGAPSASLGGAPADTLGGAPAATVGGVPAATLGGAPSAPVGGVPAAPVGVAPAAPVGVVPAATLGGAPAAPVGGVRAAPVGGAPAALVGGVPAAPVGAAGGKGRAACRVGFKACGAAVGAEGTRAVVSEVTLAQALSNSVATIAPIRPKRRQGAGRVSVPGVETAEVALVRSINRGMHSFCETTSAADRRLLATCCAKGPIWAKAVRQ